MEEVMNELDKWSGNLAELAELSGVSIHTVYKLASRYNDNPTVETAQKLIDVFTSNKR
jgi:transcriptional regulator with XRE-family HTH domain